MEKGTNAHNDSDFQSEPKQKTEHQSKLYWLKWKYSYDQLSNREWSNKHRSEVNIYIAFINVRVT